MAVIDRTDEHVEALLDAWRRWDDLPGDRGRAVDMEWACRPLAARAGCTVTMFRRRLTVACSRQLDHTHVVDRRACVEEALRG